MPPSWLILQNHMANQYQTSQFPRPSTLGPGTSVPRIQSRPTTDQGVPTEFDLGENFDNAADNDQPQQDKPRFGPSLCCRDQFSAADDRPGHDHPRSGKSQHPEEVTGWLKRRRFRVRAEEWIRGCVKIIRFGF